MGIWGKTYIVENWFSCTKARISGYAIEEENMS